MDPLDSMAGGPIPKNFDAENAENNEDVSCPTSLQARNARVTKTVS